MENINYAESIVEESTQTTLPPLYKLYNVKHAAIY